MSNILALQRIFSSNFYIDGQYAQAFAPAIFSLIAGKQQAEELSEEKMITRAQSSAPVQNSTAQVAVISIKHPISKYTNLAFGSLGSKTYQRILAQIDADPDITGVVLDIDSGGGQSYGTPELYDAIRAFSKPIVTYTDGFLCSAAYYIGNAADYIVANKRSEAIGSIGAYSSFVDFSGMFEKWGAKVKSIYATESTEKNLEWRELTENDNAEPYIKNILDPLVATFQEDMKAARPGLDEKVFKGGSWGADEALSYGLVDELGTIQTAILKVIELSAESDNNNENFKSNTDMSKENSFPKLAAVLGIEDVEAKKSHLFAADKTVSLNEEQLSQIEAALTDPGDGQKLADLQTALDAEKTAKQAADVKVTEMENAVNAAMTKAGLTQKETKVEDINLMAYTLVEYGAKPGAKPTEVHSDGDPAETTPETTSIYDSIVK